MTESKPKVVCLSGSMRFEREMRAAAVDLSLEGHIVTGPFVNMKHPDPRWATDELADPIKVALDQLHFRKIDLADEVVVVSDETGYVGESTRNEIAYAEKHGKPVRYVRISLQVTSPDELARLAFERDAAQAAADLLTQQLEDLRDDVLGDESLLVPEIVSAAGRTVERLTAEVAHLRGDVDAPGVAGLRWHASHVPPGTLDPEDTDTLIEPGWYVTGHDPEQPDGPVVQMLVEHAVFRTAEEDGPEEWARRIARALSSVDAMACGVTSPDELRERVAVAICRTETDHDIGQCEPDLQARYCRHADAVLAVVTPEMERRDAEIERLRQRVHDAVDETQRRFAKYQSRCDRFDVWANWARAEYERNGDRWGMQSEATRLIVTSLLEERNTLAWLHAEAVWKVDQLSWVEADELAWRYKVQSYDIELGRTRRTLATLLTEAGISPPPEGPWHLAHRVKEVFGAVVRQRDEKQFEVERLRRWVGRFRAGLHTVTEERDALRAQLAGFANPSDDVLDKAAVWLLRAKISRLAQDDPERTAWTWQQVLDKGDREGWRKYARLMLVDLGLAAPVSDSVPASLELQANSKPNQILDVAPPAAASADTTPRVWSAGSPAPDDSVTKVIAENDVTFTRTAWGRWLAQPPEGNERDYSWAELNRLMTLTEVLPNTEQEAGK